MLPRLLFLLLPLLLAAGWPPPLGAEIVSYAIVQDDGTLLTGGNHRLRLAWIYIPLMDRTCRTFQAPVRCGWRAVLMLDFKINGHFVHCEEQSVEADGTIAAVCRVKGEDLAAWMVQEGWALATPEAPFEYHALERIARRQSRGIWGRPVGP